MSFKFIEDTIVKEEFKIEECTVDLREDLPPDDTFYEPRLKCGEVLLDRRRGDLTFVCVQCQQSFTDLAGFGEHIRDEHPLSEFETLPSDAFQGDMPPQKSEPPGEDELHVESHGSLKEEDKHDMEVLFSPIDNESCEEGDQIGEGCANNQNNETFCCFSCGKIFVNFETYRRHYRMQHPGMIEKDDLSKSVSDLTSFVPKVPKQMLCKYCSKTFNDPVAYHRHRENASLHNFELKSDPKRHIDVRVDKRPYKCQHCSKTFTTPFNLATHVKIHLNIKRFACRICDKKFILKSYLKRHELTHARSGPYRCNDCSVNFKDERQLNKHMRQHSNNENILQDPHADNVKLAKTQPPNGAETDSEVRYTEGAEEISETEGTSSIHEAHGEGGVQSESLAGTSIPRHGTFCCYSCGTLFLKLELYRRHYRNFHPDMIENDYCSQDSSEATSFVPKVPNEMLCQYCLQHFKETAEYHCHMENAHSDQLYTCPYCPTSFIRKMDRTRHVDVHEGKRTYKCPHCPKAFVRAHILRIHVKVHSNKRQFTCQFCNKKYGRNYDLKLHERIHTNHKPFLCNKCDMKFMYKKQYNNHMRKHMNMKNYECSNCDKSFLCSSFLEDHIQTHRNERLFSSVIEELILAKDENLQQNVHGEDIPSSGNLPLDGDIDDLELHRANVKEEIEELNVSIQCEGELPQNGSSSSEERRKKFCCYSCGSLFIKFDAYRLHYRSLHPDMIENDNCSQDSYEPESFVPKVPEEMLCKYCLKKFNRPAAYHSHMENCRKYLSLILPPGHQIDAREDRTPHKCPNCSKTFKTRANLITHIGYIHMKTRSLFPCGLCGQKFKRKHDLYRHERNHMPKRIFECNDCDFKCRDKRQLGLHMWKHKDMRNNKRRGEKVTKEIHGENRLQSDESQAGITKQNDESCATFCCYSCGLIFVLFEQYRRHYRCKHPDMIENNDSSQWSFVPKVPKEMLCRYCLKTFNDPALYHKHMTNSHFDRLYTCPYCPKVFSLKCNQTVHVNIHEGRKFFKCPHCPKAFISSNRLQDHIHFHLNIKRFACRLCEKKFVLKRSLRHHERTHTNVGEFRCNDCSLTFQDERQFDFHMQKHSNIANNGCPHCDQSFNCSTTLENHILTHMHEGPSSSDIEEYIQAHVLKKDGNSGQNVHEVDEVNSENHYAKPGDEMVTMEACTTVSDQHCEIPDQSEELHTKTLNQTRGTFCCYSCGSIFMNFELYHIHYRIEHPEMIEKDDSCEKSSSFAPKVPKEMSCKYCLQIFDEPIAFHSHLVNTHLNKLYRCPQCPKAFRFEAYLRNHTYTVHLKIKPFSCRFCDKKFTWKRSLYRHELSHSNERAFRCNDCSLDFEDNRLFDFHMRQHTNIKEPTQTDLQAQSDDFSEDVNGRPSSKVEPQHGAKVDCELDCAKLCILQQKEEIIEVDCSTQINNQHCEDDLQSEKLQTETDKYSQNWDEKTRRCFEVPKEMLCKYCLKTFSDNVTYYGHMENAHLNKLYTCPYCPRSFHQKVYRTRHLAVHNVNRPYKCIHCPKAFLTRGSLQAHVMYIHSNISLQFACRFCKKKFKRKADRNRHERIHSTNVSFGCSECDLKFKCEREYDLHMQKHKKMKNYKCLQCGKAFLCSTLLEKHILMHRNERPFSSLIEELIATKNEDLLQNIHEDNFPSSDSPDAPETKPSKEITEIEGSASSRDARFEDGVQSNVQAVIQETSPETFCCYSCGIIFMQFQSYRGHYRNLHPDMIEKDDYSRDSCEAKSFIPKVPKYMLCKYCLKSFNDTAVYHHHMQNAHPNKLYTCPYCPKSFSRKSVRCHHIAVHGDQKSYKCPHCGKGFTSPSCLKTHIQYIHTNTSSQFGCRFCEQKFKRKHDLYRHERRHMAERKLACNNCSLTFTDQEKLDVHLQQHTNIMNYKCPHCDKTLFSSTLLEEHILTHKDERTFCSDIEEHILAHTLNKNENCPQNADEGNLPSPNSVQLEWNEADTDVEGEDGSTETESFTSYNDEHWEEGVQSEEFRVGTSNQNCTTFCCYSCGGIFTQFELYRIHYRREHPDMIEKDDLSMNVCDESPFVPKVPKEMLCKYCLQTFNKQTAYHSHMESAHPKKLFTCPHCSKTVKSGVLLRDHIIRHFKIKLFPCQFCDKKCIDQSSLNAHELSHPDKKSFHCNVCNLDFKEGRQLHYHMRRHIKNYKCPICDKGFVSISFLTKHILTHRSEFPFSSDLDDHTLTKDENLLQRLHEVIRTSVMESSPKSESVGRLDAASRQPCAKRGKEITEPEKPQKCPHCPQSFILASDLLDHVNNHKPQTSKNIKRFACRFCDRKLSRKHDLKLHEQIHTNDRPFQCNECDKKFIQRRLLNRHMKRHTSPKV